MVTIICLLAVYKSLGYMDVVHEAAEKSMNLAVAKVKAQSGEVIYIIHVLHT